MGDVLIGIDIGTTGVKVIGLDPGTSTIVARAGAEYHSVSVSGGGHEQNPADAWSAVMESCRKVIAEVGSRNITAVGLSGHMHSLLLLDERNIPVRPLMTWADRRVTEDTRRLASRSEFRRLGRNDVVDAFTAPKLAWLARTDADTLARARRLVLVKDYVGYLLTGEWATDETDAIGTLLYDVTTSDWSADLFEAAGASARLGVPVRHSTDVRGTVTPSASELTGLPTGTTVMIGAGDVSAAVVGAGVVDASRICLNAGTAAQIMGITRQPQAGAGFVFGSALGHGYVTMASVYAAGASVRWAERSVLGGCDINEIAAESQPGSRGLTYLPFMFGSTVPRKSDRARAAYLGQADIHGRPELAAAVLEGVAFACADAIEAVSNVSGVPDAVHVVGGVANSSIWRKALASVIDANLIVVKDGGSARGAAILAGLGAGSYDSAAAAAAQLETVEVMRPTASEVLLYKEALLRYRGWCEILL